MGKIKQNITINVSETIADILNQLKRNQLIVSRSAFIRDAIAYFLDTNPPELLDSKAFMKIMITEDYI